MDFSERTRKVEHLLRVKFPFSWAPPPISPAGQPPQDPLRADVHERVMSEIQAERTTLMAKPDSELESEYANAKSVDEAKAALKAQIEEKSRFFNFPSAKADLVYWSKAEYWSLDESIALLLGKSPEVVNWKALQAFVNVSAFAKTYERLRNLASRSTAMNRGQSAVYPSAVLAWAKEIEVPIPSELSEAFNARAAKAAATFAAKIERKRGVGSPVVGLNVRHPHSRFRVGEARWSLWGQMRTAELWQAVALSMNKDPVACEQLPGEGLSDPEVWEAYGGEEFSRRLLIADDALGGPSKMATPTDDTAEPGRVRVTLREFAAWAESFTPPWKLPGEFPRLKPTSEDIATPSSSSTQEESREERCTRVLQWFRAEEAIKKRGALARVAQRDGRTRQTVKADIDAAIRAKSPAADAIGMVTRTYKQR